jgi:hypothetical protein
VGDDYYMVNSSFEWFPCIPIYKSKDLVNWKLIGYGITRAGQLTFGKGLKDSNGIFAVTIRHHNGLFYLITTSVQGKGNFYIQPLIRQENGVILYNSISRQYPKTETGLFPVNADIQDHSILLPDQRL